MSPQSDSPLLNTPDRKTVALVETRWIGHHPNYFLEFTQALLRCGARVIGICPNPEAVQASLSAEQKSAVHCVDGQFPAQSILPGVARDNDPVTSFARWKKLGHAIRAAEAITGWRTDLVFFPYLDAWIRFSHPAWPSLVLQGRAWSGLYFRLGHLDRDLKFWHRWAKGDAVLQNKDCASIATLDEGYVEKLRELTGKPILAWPDVTNEDSPDPLVDLAKIIKEQAAGRPIIGMLGLEKRKGVITLLRMAEKVRDQRDWFFVLAGKFVESSFTAEEVAWLRKEEAARHPNLYFDLSFGRISDREFNSIFSVFDLAYAAYEAFEGSSNTLTKAALFRKPVVATAGGCIGNRVEREFPGTTMREGDVEDGIAAISRALASADPGDPAYEKYHRKHNRACLDACFIECLLHADQASTSFHSPTN